MNLLNQVPGNWFKFHLNPWKVSGQDLLMAGVSYSIRTRKSTQSNQILQRFNQVTTTHYIDISTSRLSSPIGWSSPQDRDVVKETPQK